MGKRIKIAKRHIELPKPYHVHAMTVIEQESARGAAIAGTAYLDLLLRTALELFMCEDADVLESLFDNRGALQDFSSRIKIAFAFGIIGPSAYEDLSIMRDIRNAFAHSAETVTFGRDDVVALCQRLWYAKKISIRGKPIPTEPRELFERSVEHLSDGLFSLKRDVTTSPSASNTPYIQIGPARTKASDKSSKKPRVRPSRNPSKDKTIR